MSIKIIKYIILFFVCIIVQVLIFNQIVLFHVAMPIVFIYFIIRLPIDLKPSIIFTLAFILGLIIDIFSDTPGINALACTLIAAIRKPIYFAYMPKDDNTIRLTPSVSSMGLIEYGKYLLSFVIIYCLLVFIIEYFNFADVKDLVVLSLSSSALTFFILLAADCLIPSKS